MAYKGPLFPDRVVCRNLVKFAVVIAVECKELEEVAVSGFQILLLIPSLTLSFARS